MLAPAIRMALGGGDGGGVRIFHDAGAVVREDGGAGASVSVSTLVDPPGLVSAVGLRVVPGAKGSSVGKGARVG